MNVVIGTTIKGGKQPGGRDPWQGHGPGPWSRASAQESAEFRASKPRLMASDKKPRGLEVSRCSNPCNAQFAALTACSAQLAASGFRLGASS